MNRTVNIPSSGVGVGEKKITYISTALSSDFTEKYKDKCDRTGYYSIVINDSRALSTQAMLFREPQDRRYYSETPGKGDAFLGLLFSVITSLIQSSISETSK
ncbi:hypothetical protein Btru_005852 [Bulinus truncatus]|nr:hypothetical protein Btru_005852 [Bulinus truncatus]